MKSASALLPPDVIAKMADAVDAMGKDRATWVSIQWGCEGTIAASASALAPKRLLKAVDEVVQPKAKP